jgi:hypothetical protein
MVNIRSMAMLDAGRKNTGNKSFVDWSSGNEGD